jgi:hypothetical protein
MHARLIAGRNRDSHGPEPGDLWMTHMEQKGFLEGASEARGTRSGSIT